MVARTTLPVIAASLLACREALAQVDGAAGADGSATAPSPRWALAAGFIAGVGPEHAGSSRVDADVQPGLAVRWGRLSLASHSVFALRGEAASGQGGLRLELLRGERWRSSLGLRWDGGRDAGASAAPAGTQGVRSTLRARWSTGYRFDGGWRAGAALTTDALGRGGGWEGQVDAGRDIRLTPATVAAAGVALRFAGRRWQQARFGVTPQQAALSGHPQYAPGAGIRDLVVVAGGRTDLGQGWMLFYGASVSHLAGPSADSPLVSERAALGLSAGLVKRIGGR